MEWRVGITGRDLTRADQAAADIRAPQATRPSHVRRGPDLPGKVRRLAVAVLAASPPILSLTVIRQRA
jgi:hypothetical protein